MFASVFFLLNIVYFSVCLTSNKFYWIEDQLADVSTRFYTSANWRRRVDRNSGNIWWCGCKATVCVEIREVHLRSMRYSRSWRWIRGAPANMCIPLAIPSPMDVKHSVIFEMDSSKVLLDCSKDLIFFFFIMRFSLAVFISSRSLCAWERVFSMCLLLLSTNLGMLERVTPSLQIFWPGDGTEVSANWLPLEEI